MIYTARHAHRKDEILYWIRSYHTKESKIAETFSCCFDFFLRSWYLHRNYSGAAASSRHLAARSAIRSPDLPRFISNSIDFLCIHMDNLLDERCGAVADEKRETRSENLLNSMSLMPAAACTTLYILITHINFVLFFFERYRDPFEVNKK